MDKHPSVCRLQHSYVVTKIAFWLSLSVIFVWHIAGTYAR